VPNLCLLSHQHPSKHVSFIIRTNINHFFLWPISLVGLVLTTKIFWLSTFGRHATQIFDHHSKFLSILTRIFSALLKKFGCSIENGQVCTTDLATEIFLSMHGGSSMSPSHVALKRGAKHEREREREIHVISTISTFSSCLLFLIGVDDVDEKTIRDRCTRSQRSQPFFFFPCLLKFLIIDMT